MSDDLVTQLREQASSDHIRGCQGRQYSCDCGYDIRGEGLLEQAATALTEARAEFERLNAQVDEALRSCLAEREGRLKAESELSTLRDMLVLCGELGGMGKEETPADYLRRLIDEVAGVESLRARVREVVGPFAEIAGSEAFQFQTREWRYLVIAKPTGARLAFVQADSFRAARQLDEDLK
ncbi:hypothetical protein ACWX0K_20565 [Nitrobacteraceae bacterium UC4446_H13]